MQKIMIFSEAFGSGHTKAAEAIVQAISLQEPSVPTQIIEIGKMLHPIRSKLILEIHQNKRLRDQVYDQDDTNTLPLNEQQNPLQSPRDKERFLRLLSHD